MPKEDLFTEQEADKWLELTYGSKQKKAGSLHIRTFLRKKVAVDHITNAMDKKFGLGSL